MNAIVEKTQNARSGMAKRVSGILESHSSWKRRREYAPLLNMLESAKQSQVDLAMRTLCVMANQEQMMEAIYKDKRLEAVFTNALGSLVPKVVDLVRIFYPNLISNILFDVQPLDRQNGEIFVVRPVYSNTAAGVTAGDQIFKKVTDGTYASEDVSQILATGDGTDTTFSGTLSPAPVRSGSFSLTAGAVTATEVDGQIVGTGVSGTLDVKTGAFALTFTAAPANGVAITGKFRYDSEQNPNQIRSVDIQLYNFPIQAEPHPLNVSWSTQAQLAASAHLDLDVPDTLQNLVASFIKQERDMKGVNMVLASATADAGLNFDATPPTNYSRLARYAEIEVKLDYAESQIQRGQGQGGVSWVLCGVNAADIWRRCNGFEPSDVVAPIGPHVIGTLRDGTVSVIKVPAMDPNTYVIGFKGYVLGDAATILAEWVPLYATPVFQSYNLNNYQGLMSLYALVNNNTAYYRKGTISNYSS